MDSTGGVLAQAKNAMNHLDQVPEDIVIKVRLGDQWVAVIPPDEKGLKGQDMDVLMKAVKATIEASLGKYVKEVGAESYRAAVQSYKLNSIQYQSN